MSSNGGAPLTLRLLHALAGVADRGAAPRWSTRGAASARAAVRVWRALSDRCAVLGKALDVVGAGLAQVSPRVLLFVPAVWIAMRLSTGDVLPPGAGGAVLALIGVALLVHLVRRLHHGDDARWAVRLLLAGVALRLVLGALVASRGGFPDEYQIYHVLAVDTVACWSTGGPSLLAEHPVVAGRGAYFLLLSGAYMGFGSSMIVGRVLGGLLGLLVAVLAGEVARPAGGRRAAVFAVGILALHPEHALWSATLSRDSLNAALVLVALAALVRVQRGRPWWLRALIVCIPVFLLLHTFFLAAVALAATLAVLSVAAGVHGLRRPPRLGAAVGLAGILAAAIVGGVGIAARYGRWLRWDVITATRAGRDISALAEGNIGFGDFLPDLVLTGPLDALAFLPLGLAFVLTAPWPWDAVTPMRAVYGLLQVPGLVVTVLGLAGTWFALRARPARFVGAALFALFFLVELALLEGVAGIVARHRLPLTAVLGAAAGIALAGATHEDPA